MPVHVTSEIGRLRTVVVHTPGPELLAVTPSTKEDFLYDDIIDLETARREHRRFVAVLERFCRVLHARDLLVDVLQAADPGDMPGRARRGRRPPASARDARARAPRGVVPPAPLARDIGELPAEALAGRLIEGSAQEP